MVRISKLKHTTQKEQPQIILVRAASRGTTMGISKKEAAVGAVGCETTMGIAKKEAAVGAVGCETTMGITIGAGWICGL
jgi:hypothetical protein